MNPAKLIAGQFNFNVGKLSLPLTYIQAIVVVALIFFLVLIFAQFRRHFVDWSVKGALFGIFFGFLLALILEGFLILGGRTALTSVIGWKTAPAPISSALDAGRTKLIQVLGIQDQIPLTQAESIPSVQGALQTLQTLDPIQTRQLKAIFCKP